MSYEFYLTTNESSHTEACNLSGCPCKLDPMRTARELAEKQIAVYTVGCEPSLTPYKDWFMAISYLTSGQYVPLTSANILSQVSESLHNIQPGQYLYYS
jgi:hypothetical protein